MTEAKSRPPDLEELAAYLEGRLPPERRQEVAETLLRDEDAYEDYRETLAVLEELRGEAATAGGETVPLRRRRPWVLLGSVAAAAVLALVVILAWPRSPAGTGALVASLAPLESDLVQDLPWSALRGAADDLRQRHDRDELAARLGVLAVKLEVALRAGDLREVTALTAQLEHHAAAADLLVPEMLYGELGRELLALRGEAPANLADRARTAAEELELSFQEGLASQTAAFTLGRWAETGRLAASTGRARTFTTPVFRRLGGAIDTGDLPAAWRQGVEDLRQLALGEAAAVADLELLQGRFEELLRQVTG